MTKRPERPNSGRASCDPTTKGVTMPDGTEPAVPTEWERAYLEGWAAARSTVESVITDPAREPGGYYRSWQRMVEEIRAALAKVGP